jgi:hypothetical protein
MISSLHRQTLATTIHMVFIAWNSPRSLSARHTILSLAALWIKFTFICANVLCHRNGLALTCTCVPKYFEDTLRTHNAQSLPNSNVSHYKVTCNATSFISCGSSFRDRISIGLPALRAGKPQLPYELYAHEGVRCILSTHETFLPHI